MTTVKSRLATLSTLAVVIFLTAGHASAITLGMVDDFQAGTLAGWGGGSTLTNVANAGPAGAGDNALRVAAAAAGRVVLVNTAPWTGNFNAAGIRTILIDVRNENAFALQMRLGIASGAIGSGGAGDTYVSAAAIPVAADGLWHRIAINVSGADFVPHTANSNPTPSAASALANVSHFRILHNPIANFLGANGPATFSLDNIRAVPEPAAWALAAAPFFALAEAARRRAAWPTTFSHTQRRKVVSLRHGISMAGRPNPS
jgi:hypothetical protein